MIRAPRGCGCFSIAAQIRETGDARLGESAETAAEDGIAEFGPRAVALKLAGEGGGTPPPPLERSGLKQLRHALRWLLLLFLWRDAQRLGDSPSPG